MTFEYMGGGALDYLPCQYGESKLSFRGPPANLDEPYCAVLGGSESFGKFLERPFPSLLENLRGTPVVNLGFLNAGTDVFANDETVLNICNKAEMTVIQIMGAQNASNEYYSVHPRRNDRFLNASNLLHSIYRNVDFTDIHFTGHLLHVLADQSREKFMTVRNALKENWVKKMQSILDQINGPVVLLWLADHTPGQVSQKGLIESEPMFVDRDMISQLNGPIVDIVEIITSEEEVLAGQDRMEFTALEELAAREMFGAVIHERVARDLYLAISDA